MTRAPSSHKSTATRRASAASLAALLIGFAGTAGAQSLDQEFEEGFELNPLSPAPAGDHFFLVPDGFADPDAPQGTAPIRGMLFMHYSLAPTLTRTDNETGETRNIVEHQLYAHANVTGYVAPWLLINGDLPFAVYQTGEGPTAPSSAVGDLRLGARFGVLGKRTSAFAFAPGIDIWLPTGSEAQLTGDVTIRTEPYVNLGGEASAFVYAAKVGVQFRNPVYSGSLETGTSMTFGAAAGISLFDHAVQIGPELSGRTLLESENGQALQGSTSPITTALGARFQLGSWNLGGAFGIGLTEAPGTAPRALMSLSYNPIKRAPKPTEKHPAKDESEDEDVVVSELPTPPPAPPPVEALAALDSDGDDIVDKDDACPEKLGNGSADPAMHGCPRARAVALPATVAAVPIPPADSDRDGVPDASDKCVQVAGVAEPNNAATHGCPPATQPVRVAGTAAIHKAVGGPPTATWVGFRELGGGKVLVYVNLTGTVPVTSQVKGNTLTFTLQGARVQIRNNRNPLLAEHFKTVVKSARLLPSGKNVDLVIELSGPATPVARVVQETQGATLQVELQKPASAIKPE